MAYAQFEDVQARYHLPIEDSLRTLIEARLGDAEGKIRSRIPDLDAKVASGEIPEATVVRVAADAVIRLVRNPDGYVSETDGNYTYQLAYDSGGSDLVIPAEDWLDLGVRKGIRVIHPGPLLPWEANQ